MGFWKALLRSVMTEIWKIWMGAMKIAWLSQITPAQANHPSATASKGSSRISKGIAIRWWAVVTGSLKVKRSAMTEMGFSPLTAALKIAGSS